MDGVRFTTACGNSRLIKGNCMDAEPGAGTDGQACVLAPPLVSSATLSKLHALCQAPLIDLLDGDKNSTSLIRLF